MKNVYLAILAISFLLFPQSGWAQRHWGYERSDRPHSERLDKFRKMRLIEVLKLNEEDAVRFITKQTVHENKVREIMDKRNDVLDQIAQYIKENGEPAELEKLCLKIKEADKEMFGERQRFHDEIKQLLTPAQFGKFLVFEREFGRNVRDAFEEMNRRGGKSPE